MYMYRNRPEDNSSITIHLSITIHKVSLTCLELSDLVKLPQESS